MLPTHPRHVLLGAALSFACLIPQVQSAVPSEEELLTGTWVMDMARSQFFGRPRPRGQTMIFEPSENGLQATVIFLNADGSENRVEYELTGGDEEIPLQGSENFDAIFMESRGPYLAVTTFTHAGREVGHAERRISMDGREMTVEVVRNGNLSSRALFVKQDVDAELSQN